MNSLLKRQIEKKLKNGLNDIDLFFNAVDESYNNFEDQIAMLQRAMKISSDELYEANQKLRVEAEGLKEINKNLKSILNSMNLENESIDNPEAQNSAEYIKQQAIEIVKINKQREELLKNLEKQNQALDDYTHMVSHDLKSPLRSIDTIINWYIEDNEGKIDDKSRKSLDLILFNVEKMDLLINGILNYSSIEKQESETRCLDINILLDEIKQSINVPKHIEIKSNDNLPKVFGNHFRFRQLFQNLIQNAINYNDKEKGIVSIDFVERDDEYEFSIADNGIGISEKYQHKIFDIFSKLESNTKSTGIGLSIVKKIIDLYGGKIWLESQETIGTTFYFTLPKQNGTS
jgi:signal transduction histidine kinase